MNDFHHSGDSHHPTVDLIYGEGLVKFYGRILPANPIGFFEPIHEWAKLYGEHPKEKTTIQFHLEYLNTGASKQVLIMLKTFKAIQNEGKTEVIVNWCYEPEDEDMLEASEEFEALLDMTFNKVSKEF